MTVEMKDKKYTISFIKHNNVELPIILDRKIYKIIKGLDKRWYINDKNHIYCTHYVGDNEYNVYMHSVVMKLLNKISGKKLLDRPIIHYNRINFDNREENIGYDTNNKKYKKNSKKKKRTINLNKYGIDVDKIPTFIWYMKPDKSHGSRFMLKIGDELCWKSTSSKKLSLRYKLEESKKYLRYLKKNKSNIFDKCSMNGDMTKKGLNLLKEYNFLIDKAGCVMDVPDNHNTNKFIKQDLNGLNELEINLLYLFDPSKADKY